MNKLKLGVVPWSQATTWPEMLEAAQRIDRLGFDYLWAWDHLYAILGDPHQPIFEGWSLLTAWAMATEHTRLGLLVGAVTFRNPGLVAKMAVTLDHVSNGRAILGLGGAWFDLEHKAHGIDFGHGFGQRLDWMDEALGTCRALLDGKTVTSPEGSHYAFDALRQRPLPVQRHLPIMVGGSGERKTLRSVARHADMWNAMGSADTMARKVKVLKGHCADVGRDPSQIEFTLTLRPTIRDSQAEAVRVWRAAMQHNRTATADVDNDGTFWNGTPEQMAERLAPYVELGFRTIICEQPAPYDVETLERFIGEVKPLIERG